MAETESPATLASSASPALPSSCRATVMFRSISSMAPDYAPRAALGTERIGPRGGPNPSDVMFWQRPEAEAKQTIRDLARITRQHYTRHW